MGAKGQQRVEKRALFRSRDSTASMDGPGVEPPSCGVARRRDGSTPTGVYATAPRSASTALRESRGDETDRATLCAR